MSPMIQAATLAMPKGRTATMTRRANPQKTTEGPDSQRIWRTGGTF